MFMYFIIINGSGIYSVKCRSNAGCIKRKVFDWVCLIKWQHKSEKNVAKKFILNTKQQRTKREKTKNNMPKRNTVKVKKTERKDELEEAKADFKKSRIRKRDFIDDEAKEVGEAEDENDEQEVSENEEAEEEDNAKEPPKKKKKVEKSEDFNASRPAWKLDVSPLATPNVAGNAKKLKEDITFGRIKGKDLSTKEHLSIPIYMKAGPTIAKRIRLGFNKKRPIQAPTQFESKEKGKKKPTVKKNAAWNTNVPVLEGNARDDFNVDIISAVYESAVEILCSDSLWETIGRPELKPDEHTVRENFRTPIMDTGSDGSFFKIKFTRNPFTTQKRYELFDLRGKKIVADKAKGKSSGGLKIPQVAPSTIKDGNLIDGTFEIDDLYVRPGDAMWGFGLVWVCARVHPSEGSDDEDETDKYNSKKIGKFESSDEEQEEEEAGGEEEEEEK